MMCNVLTYEEINRNEWSRLVASSSTGTWFQTPEAFELFESMPDLFRPFVVGIASLQFPPEGRREQRGPNSLPFRKGQGDRLLLRGVCVGYVTVEKNPIKQFLTHRAIIIGGPALADDCTDEEVMALLCALKSTLLVGRNGIGFQPIYIETRNFNNYSQWKEVFIKAGFEYQPHLNFHVHTNQPWDDIETNIGKHRKKYIRLSFRGGATIEENPTIDQVRAYYDILLELYRTKVKMPLLPWSFFEKLYHLDSCKYLLVMYEGQVVGGSICMLLPGQGVYEWYACGKDGVFKNIHPSSMTKYAGMKYACDNGYAIFDMMGAGKPDEEYGVRDFKAEFGGELVEYGRFICITKPLLYKIGTIGVKMLKKIK